MTTDSHHLAALAQEVMAGPLPTPVAAKIRDLTLDQVGLQLAGASDFDDYCPVTGAQVGAVVVPAGLAAARQVGASGVDLARAMAAGGEILLRVTRSGGRGALAGAAVTAGLLLDLDRQHLADAIAAALIVRAGLNSYDRPRAATEWDGGFLLERQALKKYACPASVHAAVDAVVALMSEHSLPPRRISHVQVGADARSLAAVGETAVKKALALTMLLGVPTTRTWRAAGLSEHEVAAWLAAIQVYDDKLLPGAVVTLLLADGGELRLHMEHARGTAENPMTDTELRSKFLGHAIPEAGLDRAISLDAVLWRLHRLTTIEPLNAMLQSEHGVYVTT